VYAIFIRPWHLRWGATNEELSKPLPGDELVPEPAIESTRAITVNAPVEEVWPWLAQIGQDRGGFYSYEWLENLAGCQMRNADRIHPEWQHRELGETVFLHPAYGMRVASFEPGRAIVLEGVGTLRGRSARREHNAGDPPLACTAAPERTALLLAGRGDKPLHHGAEDAKGNQGTGRKDKRHAGGREVRSWVRDIP
jgi:hypothetical protein